METKMKEVKVNGILWTWCSHCWVQTDHVFTGHGLICLSCHPEKDPRKVAEQEAVEVDPS